MASSLLIACLSQKGGVGKSTVSRLVARTYALSGWKVKIADFNPKQKTSVDWVARRLAAGYQPEIAAESFTSLKPALRQDWDLMVFDGRPDSDTSTLEIAREAHLVLIPTGVTLDDLQPQALFARELVMRGVAKQKLMFTLNKTNESQIATADARYYLMQSGLALAQNELADRVGYQMAQNASRPGSDRPADAVRRQPLEAERQGGRPELQGERGFPPQVQDHRDHLRHEHEGSARGLVPDVDPRERRQSEGQDA